MQDKFKLGDFYEFKYSFSEKEVFLFSELSLDKNPLHLDKEFAKSTVFGKRIVHGMLVSSLFSGVIANKLPGIGSIYLGQSLNFKMPIYFNQELIIRVEIIKIRTDKPIYTLRTTCLDNDLNILIDGEAIIKKNSN